MTIMVARMRRGANSVTSAVPIGQHARPMPMPADPKMIRSRARTGTADAPCFQRVISLFSLCYLLLKKLSKSLITLSDCPFVLNRLPVFLGKSPCFREKTDSQAMGLAKGEAVSAARVQNEIREFLSIFDNKYPDAPSMFEPIALLREARRQKGLATIDVPPVCILGGCPGEC
jgi:hypothetical protein